MQSGSHVVSVSLGTVAEPSGLVVVDPRTQFSEQDEEYDLEEVYSRRKAGRGKWRAPWISRQLWWATFRASTPSRQPVALTCAAVGTAISSWRSP